MAYVDEVISLPSVSGVPAALLATHSFDDLHARAAGAQWPQTASTADELQLRAACTQCPKAFNAAVVATRSVDVLHARAAGTLWPKTCIATRKVHALHLRAASARCPKALNAAMLATRSVFFHSHVSYRRRWTDRASGTIKLKVTHELNKTQRQSQHKRQRAMHDYANSQPNMHSEADRPAFTSSKYTGVRATT